MTDKKEPNIINIEDIYMMRDNITMETGSKGSEQTDENALQEEIKADEEASKKHTAEDDYEYVTLSEAKNGVAGKVIGFLREYYMLVGVILIIVFCLVLSKIGLYAKSFFLAIAFGVLVLGGSYILYEAWQDKKKAEREYKHAKSVIEPVKQKMKDKGTQE